MELHLDQVAKRLGVDPVDLRLRNLVYPGDVDPVTSISLGDARVRDCLQLGAELSTGPPDATGRRISGGRDEGSAWPAARTSTGSPARPSPT